MDENDVKPSGYVDLKEKGDVWGFFLGAIQRFVKISTLGALGCVANGAKDTAAGHRVYLRAITLLEKEFGIDNPRNAEVSEGFLRAAEAGPNQTMEPKPDDIKKVDATPEEPQA
jgi:hypothetical protein